ncbi:MAG: sulfatase-like hydrolase/transferase [Opitutales bacterium]
MKVITSLYLFLFSAMLVAERPPNVIVIMADDLGAEGLQSYGSTLYTTPHLDRLAAEGQRYNNAYATPLCTPSRVMIMSGLYPNRTGHMALMGKGKGSRMSEKIRTFGNDFQEHGYHTAMAGKWQLGKFEDYPEQALEHGFDEHTMWTWFHGGDKTSRYYNPHIHTNEGFIQGKPEEYGPDYYAKSVLSFIDKNKDDPFFVYFPMALTHTPFTEPPALVDLASSRYPEGIEKNARAFGLLITYMDEIIGKIMQRLQDLEIAENTLVIFTADNGTHKSVKSSLPDMDLQGGKGSLTEAGTRVPFITWWPGTIKPEVKEEFFCLVDVLPTICSVAGINLNREVDGMDLSHYFTGEEGQDREYVFMTWKTGSFIREKRFRLNAEGKKSLEYTMYDIPVTSDKERYGETVTENPEYEQERRRMRGILYLFA